MNSRVVALILQVQANLLGYREKPGILGKHFLRTPSEGDLRLRESIRGIWLGDCKFQTEGVRHEKRQQQGPCVWTTWEFIGVYRLRAKQGAGTWTVTGCINLDHFNLLPWLCGWIPQKSDQNWSHLWFMIFILIKKLSIQLINTIIAVDTCGAIKVIWYSYPEDHFLYIKIYIEQVSCYLFTAIMH